MFLCTEKFCVARVHSSAQAKQVNLPTVGEKFLGFCMLDMFEKQSHNTV